MKKLPLIFTACLFLSGCIGYYPVRVNGYLDTYSNKKNITPGSSFFIEEDSSAKNPIFESEVKSKIAKLLVQNSYTLTDYGTSGFLIRFNYAISPGKTVSEVRPVYSPGGTEIIDTHTSTGKTKTSYVSLPGYTTYVPYKFTVYTSSLTLYVFDGDSVRKDKGSKPIWIGEASITGQNQDLRQVINYLLTAVFEDFGKDTGKSIIVNISEKDAVLKSIE